jgi:hypothetical protein
VNPAASRRHRPEGQLARCPEPGCPVRYKAGPDRPCRWHADDDGAALLAYAAARDGLDGNPAGLTASP